MRFILILALALIALVLIYLKKQYRLYITAGFLAIVIILDVAYNFYALGTIMPFIRPLNQLTYQSEYTGRMEFPDALIPFIIKDKTIYVKADNEYDVDIVTAKGYNWFYTYLHYYATVNYAKGIGATVIMDAKMNDSVVSGDMLSDFIDLGYANDMYRNTNMYSGFDSEDLNYFGHYWYYNTKLAPMHIYINMDGLYDTDELVWLWQPISVTHIKDDKEKDLELYNETEYMFIMTKEYYDRKYTDTDNS